jgi:hypothetical protein
MADLVPDFPTTEKPRAEVAAPFRDLANARGGFRYARFPSGCPGKNWEFAIFRHGEGRNFGATLACTPFVIFFMGYFVTILSRIH